MHVIFDIGSTLLEGPAEGPATRLTQALSVGIEKRATINRILFTSNYTDPEQLSMQLADQLGIRLVSVRSAVMSIWEAQYTEAYPIPGAREALALATAAGHKVAFVSNIWKPFLDAFYVHFGEWAERCPGFYSYQMGVAKPDSAIFSRAIAELGWLAQDTIVIGDTYRNDIVPAFRIGAKTIWLLHRPDKEKEDIVQVLNYKMPRPSLILSSIIELRPEHLISTNK